MQRRIRGRAAFGAALAAFSGWAALAVTPADVALAESSAVVTEPLELVTANGVVRFEVEIADTPARQAMGLMYRTELPERRGMLFLHSPPRETTMWMRNTYIPLDMIFIRTDGTIHRIETMTEPHSEAIIASNGPVAGVLEIAGGSAQRLGLKPGDRVVHRHFGLQPDR